MTDPMRLTPEMASRKLLVLGFVRRFWAAHGGSPSYAEIGAGCGIAQQHAWQIVQELAREGALAIDRGRRQIMLPAAERISVEEAKARLRAAGFVVDGDVLGDPG